MLIKALAPILGEFRGRGTLLDGTEVETRFSGQEVIPNLCYGLRLQLLSCETSDHVVNSYIVASIDRRNDALELQLIDTKESFHDLRRSETAQADGSSIYMFQAKRSSGGLYKIEFSISSAAEFDMTVIVTSAGESSQRKLWTAHFERVQATGVGGSTDSSQSPIAA